MTEPTQRELDLMESLLRRLAEAFNYNAGGIDAVGRELVSIGNRLRVHPDEAAGELISDWLEERNHRLPVK